MDQYIKKVPVKGKIRAILAGILAGSVCWGILRYFAFEISFFLIVFFEADEGQVIVLNILFAATIGYISYKWVLKSHQDPAGRLK